MRWLFALRTYRNFVKYLARRVEVEQTLLDVANGKRELLTKEECRKLAFKLAGVK